jgi:hypothetical protein
MVRCRTQRPEPIRALGLRQLHQKSGNFVRTTWNRATKHEADPKGVGHRWHECDLGVGDFQVSVDQHDCPASCDLAKDPA